MHHEQAAQCATGIVGLGPSLKTPLCCRTGTDLYRELDRCSIGDEVDLEVLRGSEKAHLKVTLGSSS